LKAGSLTRYYRSNKNRGNFIIQLVSDFIVHYIVLPLSKLIMAKTVDHNSDNTIKTRMKSFVEAFKECKEIKEMIGTLIKNYKDDSLVENTLQRFTSKTGLIYLQGNLIIMLTHNPLTFLSCHLIDFME